MGTKNCPETPRQKMINMMYLVLTAMLALNVAAETLDAFKVVDNSLMQTFKSFNVKNKNVILELERQYEINQDRVEQWLTKAKEVEVKTDSIIKIIRQTKVDLVQQAGGLPLEPGEERNEKFPYVISLQGDTIILEAQDDLNAAPYLMVEKGRGADLQSKIEQYKVDLLALVDNNEILRKALNSAIDISDPEPPRNQLSEDKSRTWAQKNFTATPVVAGITLLSKLQLDVLNGESAILNHLYNQIDASSYKFTNLNAEVIPENTYLFEGQEFKGKIFLSAIDSTQDIEVYIDGSNNKLKIDPNDKKAMFSLTPPIGDHVLKGYINFKSPDGATTNRLDFEQPYKVVMPEVTISPTKMNVIFRNLENPISISVPGVDSDLLLPEMSNGSIFPDGDQWIARPDELDDLATRTKVSVYAEIDGERRLMGEMPFRVKKVPNPIATVAQKNQGNVNRDILRTQQLVSAELRDFYFDLKFEVLSFEMVVPSSGGEIITRSSNSYAFTAEQKQLLNNLGADDKLLIQNIKARISGDETDPVRILSPIVITVQ